MKTVRIHSTGYIPALKANGPIFSKTKISDQLYNQLINQGIIVEVVKEKINKPTIALPVHKEPNLTITPKNPLMNNEEIDELLKEEVIEEVIKEELVEEVIVAEVEELIQEEVTEVTDTNEIVTIKSRTNRGRPRRNK